MIMPDRVRWDPRVWMLVTSALPIGGYSYSQGLEHANTAGWVDSFDGVKSWILGLATTVLPRLDLPLLIRMHGAADAVDHDTVRRWNDRLLAARDTSELRREDLELGRALARLCRKLGLQMSCLPEPPTLAAAFALACQEWQIDAETACAAYAWVWCENQVTAAVKLVPLGQSDGRRILLEMTDRLSRLVAASLACPDDQMGMTAPGMAIASAGHEIQHTRLFRS